MVTDYIAIKGDISTIDVEVKDFDDRITDNTEAIAKNAADIAENAGKIADNAQDIADNAQDIADNAGNISKLSQLVSGLIGKVSKLRALISNLSYSTSFKKQSFSANGDIDADTNLAVSSGTNTLVMPLSPVKGVLEIKSILNTTTLDAGTNTFELTGTSTETVTFTVNRRFNLDGTVWLEL